MADSGDGLVEYDVCVMLRFDREGNVLSANRKARETYGYTEEEFRRLRIYDLDPQYPPGAWPANLAGVPKGGALRLVRRNRRKDGREFPARIVAFRPETGDGTALIGFVHDISDQVKTEFDLRRAQFILDRALEQVILSTREGAILYVNDAACRTLGYDREELLGMTLFEINPRLLTPEDLAVLRRDAALERGCPHEAIHKAKDGRTYPVEMVITPLKFGEDEIFCAFIREISERKRAEEALRESERFLSKSQEVAHLGSYSLDLATGEAASSAVLDRILGISAGHPKTLAGWTDLVAPDQREWLLSEQERVVNEKCARFDYEYRIRRPSDGEERWVHDISEMEFDGQGTPVRILGTMQDITERKKAEEEREELEAQLRQSHKMETVGRLAGGVAHEFNNMLAVILGYTELLRNRIPKDDPLQKFVAEIDKAGSRSRDITMQLLAFSRKQVVSPKVLDLNAQLSGMVNTLGGMIGEEVRLAFLPGKDVWNVRIDPTQIDQVVVNLAINARDAMPGGGRLTIGTENTSFDRERGSDGFSVPPGDYVCMSVADDGIGMDEETLSHLFEPFFTTKGIGKGTGLGLPTVYGIIKQNGGFIEAESRPGKGTTFRVCLPRHLDGAEAPQNTAEGAAASEGFSPSILLVEDDEMVRRMVLRLLENFGYKVCCAALPQDAVNLCRKRDFPLDLLITDVVMPGMNGRELWETVKTLRPGAKVLFMSGYTSDEISGRGIREGEVGFINKPFTESGLARAVKEAISRRRG